MISNVLIYQPHPPGKSFNKFTIGQDGEKGEATKSAITCLETARDSIYEAVEQLNEARE
jgi:hypothetical protein